MRALLRDWRFWLALAALAALAILLASQGDLTCRIPRKRMQMEISKANSCFEFWLNRYQQLIAAALAVGAAALTIRQINSQINESRRQTAAAALDPARNSLQEFEGTLRQSRHCHKAAEEVRAAILLYPQPDTMHGYWGGRSPEMVAQNAVQLAQDIRTHVFADSRARNLADQLEARTVELSRHLEVLKSKLVPLPASAYGPITDGQAIETVNQPDIAAAKASAANHCAAWMHTLGELADTIEQIVIARRQTYLRLEELSFGGSHQ